MEKKYFEMYLYYFEDENLVGWFILVIFQKFMFMLNDFYCKIFFEMCFMIMLYSDFIFFRSLIIVWKFFVIFYELY